MIKDNDECTTNGESLAIGSVCNLCNSRKEKEHAEDGTRTQSQDLDRESHFNEPSIARHEQKLASRTNHAPTLCPAKTILTEAPKVDCTASNILRTLWSCVVKPKREERRVDRGCFEARDGAWPTWENVRMASVPEVSKSWIVSRKCV